ncbi:hypothetical protein COV58_02155 [Candidatus Roizmanbacteria bacterium CG11_big_fil_rev_8_21_14_0_20_36_8]|uniref:Glycosyl transferase family 1 domain-containing protein n=1 Tax=Candidatus Roizmanbacteria bacterium CG11_big_fil_rev_8_21_14_0_20_36_8 TaxID=1974856 RepID=A0A2M6IU88_9BACT|nr:MAG: hypothetical protein COV58_02155 [Candidatus Roizmanbacteria bacterium CG11_big_fil_rev_8_21_14_0_20_36_8]
MDKTYIIATHNFAFGTSQALKKYFERHKITHLFIQHELMANPLTWFLGMADTFWKVLQNKEHFDVFIGSNRLNAFVGIWLKKVGKVSKVVYFSPDWVEDRHSNKVLNYLYQWLDYFCVKHSDVVWDSSAYMKVDRMMQERLKRGYESLFMKKHIQVPDGTDPCDILPFNKISRNKIGFVGHIKDGLGLEMMMRSFRNVYQKNPNVHLVVIGSGPLLKKLKRMGKDLPITFTGFMGDITKVYKTLSDCAFALAPYEHNTITKYTDPGKVKVYFSIGLPIIISRVPLISKEVNQKKCGIVIDDNELELTNAMLKLLQDDKLLRSMRVNVVLIKDKYSWDNIFQRALLKTFNIK